MGSVWSPHPHRSINQPVLTKLFVWHKHARTRSAQQPLLMPEMLHPQPQLPTQGSCKYCRFKELQKNLRPTLEKTSKTCSVAEHKFNKLRKLGPATEPLQEKEKQQRLEADRAAKLAKKRAANRERMQRLRNEDAFRDLEVCYCFMAPLMQILHDVSC